MGRFFWEKFLEFGLERRSRLLAWAVYLLPGIGVSQAQVPENTIPMPVADNVQRCGAGSVTFVASGCTAGFITKWYAYNKWNGGINPGNEVGSGTTFTTPVLYEPTMYFLACVSDQDSSIRSLPANVFAEVFLSAEVSIQGIDPLCSNNEGNYRGFPKGGTFSLPVGLPDGFVTIDTVNSEVTLHAGYEVPTFSFGYASDHPLPECAGAATKTVTRVSAVLPTVNSPIIYPGQTATLTVENCPGEVQWVWTYEANTRRIYVSPTATSEYFAECNVEGICDTRVTATVTVVPRPESIVSISGPDSVCLNRLPLTYVASPAGGNFILPKGLPSGAFTVNGNSLTFNPGLDIANTSFGYEFTGTDSNGKVMTSSATKYLTFTPPAKPTITPPVAVCKGAYVILTVENCPGKVIWSTREEYPSIVDYPRASKEYSARCVTGGCDTTLTTKVTVDSTRIWPSLFLTNAGCSQDRKTYDVVFGATEGSIITTSFGAVMGNKVVGIPARQEVEITATLNGCPVTLSTNDGCYASTNCTTPLTPVIVPSKASCSATGVKSDATIDLGYVYADRFSFATTAAELSTYADAIPVVSSKATISDLPNPATAAGQVYHIRLFGRSDTCSRDTTVVLPYRDCSIPCAKPDAGNDFFVSRYRQEFIKLPDASPNQKWVLGSEPFDINDYTFINPSTGLVAGLYISGRYQFILQDGGAGGPCADTAYVFVGPAEAPELITYSDTLTLPKYLLSSKPGAAFGQWMAMPGNPATLTSEGKVSGLTAPGRYLFRIVRPFNPDTSHNPYDPWDALTLVVVKLAKPDDCPPQLCVPFSIKKLKLAAR